jgi:hypothetical protein
MVVIGGCAFSMTTWWDLSYSCRLLKILASPLTILRLTKFDMNERNECVYKALANTNGWRKKTEN